MANIIGNILNKISNVKKTPPAKAVQQKPVPIAGQKLGGPKATDMGTGVPKAIPQKPKVIAPLKPAPGPGIRTLPGVVQESQRGRAINNVIKQVK